MIPPATVMPHDPSKSPTFDGWISEYSAQGTEGDVWRIFQDERYARTDAGGWQLEGMHCLGAGQVLTVFDAAGAVLYSGELRSRRMHWWSRRWIDPVSRIWCPLQVSAAEWASWFAVKPPLRARLQL